MANTESEKLSDEASTLVAEKGSDESDKPRLDLTVDIEQAGPCKRHVRIKVPRNSIDDVYKTILEDYTDRAEVPGFRVGHVPADLVKRRFKNELAEQVKQRVLMASLEQLSEESEIDPINEPNLDLENIEIPEEGDFEFEFDVEVRPEFDMPKYKGLKIKRPSREITDADVSAYLDRFLQQYGKLVPVDAPAKAGDYVTVDIVLTHNGATLTEIDDVSLRVRKTLRFQDAELADFDKFMVGAKAGDVRETDVTVSMEADSIEMRGEKVHAKFTVLDVKHLETPELTEDFLERLGAASLEDLNKQIHGMLERQVKYEQRQSCRRQVLEQITDSANWDLPEELVSKQVDNALRREILEMQQAGFTSKEILARENELRQRSLTMTRKNLKEHFVLDRLAEEEKIEVTEADINAEIGMMAMQRGENPRRVKARMAKSGMLDNLFAQIRERKAVDVILDSAEFVDEQMAAPVESDVEALNRSVCRTVAAADTEDDAHQHDHDCDHDHDHDH
ncbi:trigger factor [Planctomicrobium sp. SH661]|uniref:trigger factor n=1 Tax=Planctomicrobium sp. SH661 TaxID=3448124 RepID=UPI003F5BEDF2